MTKSKQIKNKYGKIPTLTLPEGTIGPYAIGGRESTLVVIAGPCVIESLEHCCRVAEYVKTLCDKLGINYIFKASFDKANRSSITSKRGPGIRKGLEILSKVRKKIGVPILSDIHEPSQAASAGKSLDVIQIPAFLARQTDLLLAAAKTGKTVNVKKAQFMSAWEMENVVDKLKAGGSKSIVLTERGNFFGYNRWVVDMRNIEWMHRCGVPVIIDATHGAADPGGSGTFSGGDREMGPLIARSGLAAGADGLFVEVHDNPDQALSDKATVLPLTWLEEFFKTCMDIFYTVR
jgi:2-dehydro-3-deoxyphosphooctonate aldolase (KDO 8-P synthase)